MVNTPKNYNKETTKVYTKMSIPESKRIAFTKSKLPPCALRYHPLDSSLLFLGTYNLIKETGKRTGSIEIYKHNEQDQDSLELIHSEPTESAILDMKFSPHDDSLFITCHSTGDLTIWRYELDENKLINLHHQQIFEQDVLITSLIFSQTLQNKILLTCTDGYLALVELQGNSLTEPIFFGTQHELECWTGAFGNMAELSNVLFTGGDDGALIAHDLREPESMSIFHARRTHEAGVVAIQTSTFGNHNGVGDWFVDKPYTLWTGSYDDQLRSLDLRVVPDLGIVNGIIPRVQNKLNLGGGVWRFQPSTIQNDNRLLTCCMYNGARIIGAKSDTEPIVDRFFKKDHESMVYGCDWSPDGQKVATCSFYDNVLQIWSPNDIE
ncbi:hypothetical protein BN7_6651 [Wickerhamomyces ciferrii]|uniref:methylated diphthine methylhydrolase n=1 Tax=Wickerhamomyces ciferrii (strain ATCC 14091 / BCRC 22168 / CBS 111 / JCM 3599 / NBRC 0793 / NRRL Y-1031 F-60-10) TaxID=1206466 RepID=K0KY91_WICCF|nr:uncharacterized protein BN7_6651 [Wickerhamomyces ciferrii]CCH47042.1 hypothetical protein BN7_6651 [Wickerhamomyces ciferrii]